MTWQIEWQIQSELTKLFQCCLSRALWYVANVHFPLALGSLNWLTLSGFDCIYWYPTPTIPSFSSIRISAYCERSISIPIWINASTSTSASASASPSVPASAPSTFPMPTPIPTYTPAPSIPVITTASAPSSVSVSISIITSASTSSVSTSISPTSTYTSTPSSLTRAAGSTTSACTVDDKSQRKKSGKGFYLTSWKWGGCTK